MRILHSDILCESYFLFLLLLFMSQFIFNSLLSPVFYFIIFYLLCCLLVPHFLRFLPSQQHCTYLNMFTFCCYSNQENDVIREDIVKDGTNNTNKQNSVHLMFRIQKRKRSIYFSKQFLDRILSILLTIYCLQFTIFQVT